MGPPRGSVYKTTNVDMLAFDWNGGGLSEAQKSYLLPNMEKSRANPFAVDSKLSIMAENSWLTPFPLQHT